MKKLFLILGLFSFITACGPDYKAEVEKLKQEQQSLLANNQAKNDELNSYIRDINEIQTSIDELVQKEQLLRQNGNELSKSAKTKILEDIKAIRKLIDSNKRKVANLQSKLKKSNQKVTELESMIGSLNQQLEQRDQSISSLNQEIANLNGKITNMESELVTVKTDNETKSKEISEKTVKLNTAYYTVGDYRSLREQKVISNEGTILNKSKNIDPDFNSNAFTKIDITKTQTIEFNEESKKVELASVHPTNTYAFVKEMDKVTGIQITNPEGFWSSSKYLVVVTK